MNAWDDYFIKMCDLIASKSKDLSTKVGAVIVGPYHEVRATGFNGLPRGVNENSNRLERPSKYLWTEHAERNCIYSAARMGTLIDKCTIYINSLPPCSACARAIIQAGIAEVVCEYHQPIPKRWEQDCNVARCMLEEANVIIRYIDRAIDVNYLEKQNLICE